MTEVIEQAQRVSDAGIVTILVLLLAFGGAALWWMLKTMAAERAAMMQESSEDRNRLQLRVDALSDAILAAAQDHAAAATRYAEAAAKFAEAEASCQQRLTELSIEVERLRAQLHARSPA